MHVAGVPSRGVTVAEVAASAVSERGTVAGKGGDAAFSASIVYRGKGDGGWSVATHACIVEVDLETGLVTFPRYLVVEDCGPIINPAIVDGQVRGGVAQGIGAVLYEKAAYDDEATCRPRRSWTTCCRRRWRSPTSRSTTSRPSRPVGRTTSAAWAKAA